jgi:hypothetical protein
LEFKTMAKRLSDVAKSLNWETRGDAAPVVAGVVIPESNELLGKVLVVTSVNEAVAELGKLQSFVIAPHFDGEPGRSRVAGLAVVTNKADGSVMYMSREIFLDNKVVSVINSGKPIVCHACLARRFSRSTALILRYGDRVIPC